MRSLLSVVLVVVIVLACYGEEVYLFYRAPQVGESIPFTLRSQRVFHFDQAKAFGGKRNLALSQYVPLYTHLPERVESARKKMEELLKRVAAAQMEEKPDAAALVRAVRKDFGVDLTPEAGSRLLAYEGLTNIVEGLLTIEESLLRGRIVEDAQPLKGKKTVEVLYPEPVGTVEYPVAEFTTLDEAKLSLRRKAYQLFWQVDRSILEPVVQIALGTILPNLTYDEKENDRRIEEVISRYPSRVIAFRPGEVLVPLGAVLTEEDVLLLTTSREAGSKDRLGTVPWVLCLVTLMVVLYNQLLTRVVAEEGNRKPCHRLSLSLIIITVLLLKACLLFTPFPAIMLPVAVLPLLLILLTRDGISTVFTTALGAVLVSLFVGRSLEVLFLFVLGAQVAVLASLGIRKRSHLLGAALSVGMTNALIVIVFSIDWASTVRMLSEMRGDAVVSLRGVFETRVLARSAWAFAGGFLAAPLALLLLPAFETGWRTASAFKLTRFADLQHPLLRDLLTKAPGTYQHVMTVAYLAQAAGEAIGADTLLLRIGAYYHDIGKTARPQYFVENQFGMRNPHDDLDPKESATLIVDHVRDGVRIAREARLPDTVIDFIPQHHGTQLIEYFYGKAHRANEGTHVSEHDFRYPGPKPQTVETALLMIADAAEAASRTIQEPSREKIEHLVRLIVEKRIADGQFDECNLSTRELGRIVRALTSALEATLHTRIEYPWQEKQGEA